MTMHMRNFLLHKDAQNLLLGGDDGSPNSGNLRPILLLICILEVMQIIFSSRFNHKGDVHQLALAWFLLSLSHGYVLFLQVYHSFM